MSLKVCMIAPLPPPYGGISNWAVLVLRFIKSRGDFAIKTIDIAPRWRTIDDLSVWKRVISGGLKLIFDYSKYLYVLLGRPDVVHLTTSGRLAVLRDVAVLATARIFRISTVYHIRIGRIPDIVMKQTVEWKILYRAIMMASAVIALDNETAAVIRRCCSGITVRQIPNGIDVKKLPISSSSKIRTVIYLGWVIPTKGIEELCQAWSQLSLTGWRCIVVGPGSEIYRQELRNRFHLKNLTFISEKSHEDAMRLLAASDVLVLPSYTEGFPNVIIEAMAMGKAIVATSVGAIPEMLADGCGMLVPPQDVGSFAAALSRVCIDEHLRASIGSRAKEKAYHEYAIDKVLDQLTTLWNELSGDKSKK